ncbi:zinc-dependent alcohol dehydrogenase [Feifania hominis]|uniref:Galactitol-1-phosphate 5-dehydrogenase n=1 Tax=Feifania hominis TaxID=2763660 RepID=A0A926HVZ4_9FIRM|nr:galactitol-1-phosphate 5-dehydrogenase [Feifania hominis]MBC8537156.1 galactitol-1-phosphate 5-dehydrogenase [Feifania hominis]
MRALVLKEYKKLVCEQIPTPDCGEGEVLIRLKCCAVCGSDVHGYDGSTGRRIPPIVMGHEASGVIEKVGAKVKNYKPGDRVTFDSTVYCNECEMCKAGRVNLCRNRRVLGVSCDEYRRDGAFAEYIAVPEYILYRLPDNVTFRQAAMVEPLSIAYHGVTRAEIRPGATVAVVGVGTIGMMALQLAKSMGAATVIAVDIDEKRLEMALQNGATHAVNSREADALERLRALTPGGEGVDVAVDATGIQATADLCVNAAVLGGQVVFVGNLAARIEIPLQVVVTRELSLFGSCASAGEYDKCLALIAGGQVDVDALISAAVPLEEGAEWIERVYRREPGLYKIVLTME